MDSESGIVNSVENEPILGEQKESLAHPPEMDEVIDQIANADWYVEEAKKKMQEKSSKRVALDSRNFQGELGEAMVRAALEHAASNNKNISLDPIEDGVRSENYVFRRQSDGRLYAHSLNSEGKEGDQVVEYDEVVLVHSKEGDIPVIIEAKVQNVDGSGRMRKVKDVMRKESVERILGPVRDLFQTDNVGMVVVTTDEIHEARTGDVERQFLEEGGVVVSMPVDMTWIWAQMLNSRFGK